MKRNFYLLYLGTILSCFSPLSLFSPTAVAEEDRKSPPVVEQWTVFEMIFMSSQNYWDPVRDVQLEVCFTAPDQSKRTVQGFWDGGKTWKACFSPDQTGEWEYETICSKEDNTGLHNKKGRMICIPYGGDNPLYRHGALRISENRRYFTYDDDVPFFWLGDTVWNGPLMAEKKNWDTFLDDRARKGFNVIQFVTTQWRAAEGNAEGRPAFTGNILIQIRPDFFQRLDHYFEAINDHGMIAAPVMLWAVAGKDNPGYELPEDQKIVLAEYLLARYDAYQVVWFLGGDGKYMGEKSESWKRIGRKVFRNHSNRLVTMHPSHYEWVGEDFRMEPWYSFIGYQSGHGDSETRIRWLLEGPPTSEWKHKPSLPVINLEPNYEDIIAYDSKQPFNAHAVRRAAYWSLLITPPAGITYGAHGIWGWHLTEGPALRHSGAGIGKPWHEAMKLPGSSHMGYLKSFFQSIEWWKLIPAQELLVNQPGISDPTRFVAAAKSIDNDFAVIYVPKGDNLEIRTDLLRKPLEIKWFNPRNGTWLKNSLTELSRDIFHCPNEEDWILFIRS